MTDALPAIEKPRTVVDKLYLFVCDQEAPNVGCSGHCYSQGLGGNVPYRAPTPALRRATAADLEALGFVRKAEAQP